MSLVGGSSRVAAAPKKPPRLSAAAAREAFHLLLLLRGVQAQHPAALLATLGHDICPLAAAVQKLPLAIEATEVITKERDFKLDFLKNIIGRIEWPALLHAAAALSQSGLPATAAEVDLSNEDSPSAQALHHILLEVHLKEGHLVCQETGRRFRVSDGIPNMLLAHDEA